MTTTTETDAPAVASPSASRRPGVGSRVLAFLPHLVLVAWALMIILPLLWTFLASFKNTTEIFSSPWTLPGSWRWENWSRAWTQAKVGRYFLNSVFVVAISTFFTMLLGSMAAYVLARYRFFGNRAVYYLFVSGLAFPTFLAIVPLFFIVRQMGTLPVVGPFIGLNTYGGLILVYIAYSLPFTVFFLTAFFRTLPTSIAEAAMIDGAGHVRTFFRVMLPMARAGMVSVGIFNIIGQWAQYLLPVVLMAGAPEKQVLTQGIASISVSAGYAADWSGLFAALTIAILPMIAVYAVFQRQIQSGLTAGALK